MKRLVSILPVFLLLFGLISCKPDPVKFNDELMTSLNDADKEYSAFYSLVDEFSDGSDLTTISKKGKESISEMEKLIEKIKVSKTPNEGEEFKKACTDYITIMVTSIKGFVSEEQLTKKQFMKAVENMDSNEVKLNDANEKIMDTQGSFAQKTKIELIDSVQKK